MSNEERKKKTIEKYYRAMKIIHSKKNGIKSISKLLNRLGVSVGIANLLWKHGLMEAWFNL
jgi:hypothetical protein